MAETLEVGDVEVDLLAREIRRRGVRVELQPRVFDLFEYLLERRERVVTKRELLESVWAGHAVVPDVLTTAFYSLRRALQDDPKKPIYIRTVHRVGYQLVATVTSRTTPPPRANGETSFPALDARHAAFIGRDAQKQLFGAMLAGTSTLQVLFLHGLPGIGKTTLVQELVFHCRQVGIDHVWLSGETAGPTVDAFVLTLARELGCESSFEGVRGRLARGPIVVFVDDAHLLGAVDAWIRQTLWPVLPAHARLVLAGRNSPSARWRCDPAWVANAHAIELPALTLEEARAFFIARGASTEHSDVMWSRARGHPLALTLVADILARDEHALDVFEHADSIEVLVAWLTDQIDVSAHERGFEMACLFDEVSVRILAAVDDPNTADACARWLGSLSFVERMGEMLRVHALVREAVIARLAGRHPARLADLIERCHRFCLEEITTAPDLMTRLRAVYQFLNQGRHHPALRAAYAASDVGPPVTAQPAAPHELPCLLEMVKVHEGAHSMAINERWLKHPKTRVWSVRGEDEASLGFVVGLHLAMSDALEAAADPVASAIFDFARSATKLERDDEILIYRTIITGVGYQEPSIASRHLHAAMCEAFMWHSANASKVTDAFVVYTKTHFWELVAHAAGYTRVEGHDVDIERLRYTSFHQSLRGVTPESWLELVSRRLVQAIREATPH